MTKLRRAKWKKVNNSIYDAEWRSYSKRLTIDKSFDKRDKWDIAVTSRIKGIPPQLMADTNNTKQQAFRKAKKYMREE